MIHGRRLRDGKVKLSATVRCLPFARQPVLRRFSIFREPAVKLLGINIKGKPAVSTNTTLRQVPRYRRTQVSYCYIIVISTAALHRGKSAALLPSGWRAHMYCGRQRHDNISHSAWISEYISFSRPAITTRAVI